MSPHAFSIAGSDEPIAVTCILAFIILVFVVGLIASYIVIGRRLERRQITAAWPKFRLGGRRRSSTPVVPSINSVTVTHGELNYSTQRVKDARQVADERAVLNQAAAGQTPTSPPPAYGSWSADPKALRVHNPYAGRICPRHAHLASPCPRHIQLTRANRTPSQRIRLEDARLLSIRAQAMGWGWGGGGGGGGGGMPYFVQSQAHQQQHQQESNWQEMDRQQRGRIDRWRRDNERYIAEYTRDEDQSFVMGTELPLSNVAEGI